MTLDKLDKEIAKKYGITVDHLLKPKGRATNGTLNARCELTQILRDKGNSWYAIARHLNVKHPTIVHYYKRGVKEDLKV